MKKLHGAKNSNYKENWLHKFGDKRLKRFKNDTKICDKLSSKKKIWVKKMAVKRLTMIKIALKDRQVMNFSAKILEAMQVETVG